MTPDAAFVLADLSSPGWEAPPRGAQGELSDQARLHSVRQVQPVLAGSWRQAAEGTKNLLPRTFGGAYGFDEEIIVVGFALVSLGGLADVHRTLYIASRPYSTSMISTTIRHYFTSSTTFAKNKELPARDITKSVKYRGSYVN